MVERLQSENGSFKAKFESKEKELHDLKMEVKDYEQKSAIHEKIEKQLKDKIHNLQQEYYQTNREKIQTLQDVDEYNEKLREMGETLEQFELQYDLKEKELSDMKMENSQLLQELQNYSKEKLGLIS